jgi:hypothetical protein
MYEIEQTAAVYLVVNWGIPGGENGNFTLGD